MISRNRFSSRFARVSRELALLPVLLLPVAASTFAGGALLAQKPAPRTLEGSVTQGGNPAKGAVVHLKDTRALSQRSYIVSEDGKYHFSQLSANTDYQVWADIDGKKSAVRSISSFDTKTSFNIDLKFD